MEKLDNTLSIAIMGDVHLDHVRVPTAFVIERLDEIYTDEYMSKLDVIVINGDLFERRVMFDSDSAHRILRWIVRFLQRCAYFNVTLHILEGTPSHDHRQAKWFEEVLAILVLDIEFYYHQTLEITPIRRGYEATALWIPDELNTSAAVTQDQVERLLVTENQQSVTFAFIHGMFVYQEPMPSPASHNEVFYESIVDQLIVINHIHTPSSSGKIRAPGSPCRLRHNEEETKGHLYLEYGVQSKVVQDWFIETPNNAIFTTVDIQGMDIIAVKRLLDEQQYAGVLQHIRLKLKRTDHVLSSIPDLKKRYPHLHLSTKVIDDDLPEVLSENIIDKPVFVSITPDTLADLLLVRMDKHTAEVKDAAQRLLAESVE